MLEAGVLVDLSVDSLLLVATTLITRDVACAVQGKQNKDDAWELSALAAARVARGDKEFMVGGIMLLRD